MKYFSHSINIPRQLDLRYQKPVNDATKAWDNFRGTKKVQDRLIPAQKYLCSYCEVELVRGNRGDIGYHIEHIEPKSINPARTFDFSNLLVSCFDTGYELVPSDVDLQPISCGHAKKSEFNHLFIKPTEQGCEDYFFYELDGRIVANPGLNDSSKLARVNYTITLLNLNCRRLKRERKDMIEEGLNIINDLSNAQDALSHFSYCELDEFNGKNRAYFTTRRQYFSDFL